MRKALALLALLAATPSAVAITESIDVYRTFDEEGHIFQKVYPNENFLNATFNLNPLFYNTSGYDNDTVSRGDVQLTYLIDKDAFSTAASREYTTRLLINGTDYLNVTTNVAATYWLADICTYFTYYSAATGEEVRVEGTPLARPCESNLFGGTPDEIQHWFVWESKKNETQVLSSSDFAASWFRVETRTDETSVSVFSSERLGVGNFTNFTLSATLSGHASHADKPVGFFGDEESVAPTLSLLYQFSNYATAQAERERHNRVLPDRSCSIFGLDVPCSPAEILSFIFGFVKAGLGLVFGFFPGGAEIATFMSELVTILIGIPTYGIYIFLLSPGKWLLYHTLWLTCVGLLRYGLSQSSDFSVVYQTPLAMWKFLYKALVAFGAWLYDLVIKLAAVIRG